MLQEETYTCIFGGGAVRGFAYIGAIKALRELKFNCDTIVGSSVGAILAAFVAIGCSYEEIKKILMGINFELFRDINFGIGTNIALSKGNVFTNWVRENIEKKYYGKKYKKGKNKPVTFEDIEKDLLIYTTDIASFKCKEFSKQETPDFEIAEAVKISCSMPGLMVPAEIDGRKLVDGDLLKSKPLWKHSKNLKLGKNKILEFRLEGEYEKVDNNIIDFINAVYSCMTHAATEHVIDCYGCKDDFDYIKINTGDLIILDFNLSSNMRNHLINIGYEQSVKYLTEDLYYKKLSLINYYTQISQHLNSILDYIKAGNIEHSKLLLGELYILLADFQENISSSVYEKIQLFKKEFLISSKGKSWLFGIPKFRDKGKLLKVLIRTIFEVNTRINKLKQSTTKIEILKPVQ